MEQLLNLASKSRGDGATFQDSEQIQKPWSKFSSWRASFIFIEQFQSSWSKNRGDGATFQNSEQL